MWTLGFDSAADTVSASLLRDGALYSLYSSSSATTHSTTLLPAILKLLSAAGIDPSELSLIGCSAGPGSFTGIRIGTSTAKGLAAPHGIPCVGVSAVEGMAYMFEELEGILCPGLNARRGNVYTALFHSDGNGKITRMTEDSLVAVSEIADFITQSVPHELTAQNKIYVTGDSNEDITSSLRECGKLSVGRTPALMSAPSAYGVARCAFVTFNRAEDRSSFSGASLAPIYLRKSQAERELEEKKSKIKAAEAAEWRE